MRRLVTIAGALILLVTLAGTVSYRRALATAAATLCPLPPGTELVRVRFGPQLTPAQQLRPAWTFSYGPVETPGHEGFQLFLTPAGSLMSTNPADLLDRLVARPERAGARCGGTA